MCLKSSSKLLDFALRHGSNPDNPTPSNTDASLSVERSFALLVQRGKFAGGLVPGDIFSALMLSKKDAGHPRFQVLVR